MTDPEAGNSGGLKVEDRVSLLVDDLRQASDMLNGEYIKASSVSTDLTSVWKGLAGAAAAGLQGNASENIRDLRDTINTMAEILEMSLGGFSQQEEDRLQEIRAVEKTLEPTRINMGTGPVSA